MFYIKNTSFEQCVCMYIYIYIYIYRERERENWKINIITNEIKMLERDSIHIR